MRISYDDSSSKLCCNIFWSAMSEATSVKLLGM